MLQQVLIYHGIYGSYFNLFLITGLNMVFGASHSLFASLSQLETVWKHEITNIKMIETYLATSNSDHLPLQRYIYPYIQ